MTSEVNKPVLVTPAKAGIHFDLRWFKDEEAQWIDQLRCCEALQLDQPFGC
jgi:hypothetical protein